MASLPDCPAFHSTDSHCERDMNAPTSAGLRKYQELCLDRAPAEVKGGVWIVLAHWVADNVRQSDLVDVSFALWRDLSPISQASNGTPEELLADAIRDASDVTWYAMTEESIAIFERHVESVEKLGAVP